MAKNAQQPLPAFDWQDMMLETTIAGRDPNGATLQARLGDFPPQAIEKFLRYGFQRIFNDATGGSMHSAADKVAAARDMIERFKRGEIGRVARESVDALTQATREEARRALKLVNPDGYKRLRAGLKDESVSREDYNAKLDAIVEKNPALVEKAKQVLAARAEAVSVDFDGIDV